jgi:hypothetical protein
MGCGATDLGSEALTLENLKGKNQPWIQEEIAILAQRAILHLSFWTLRAPSGRSFARMDKGAGTPSNTAASEGPRLKRVRGRGRPVMGNREDEFEEIDDFSSLADQLARPIGHIQREQVRQARITFNAALAIRVTGTLVLLAGVASFLYHSSQANDTGRAITVASGIVMDFLSFFMIKFHRETNSRLDEIRRDESAIRLVAEIQDPVKRDEAISELAKALRRGSLRR